VVYKINMLLAIKFYLNRIIQTKTIWIELKIIIQHKITHIAHILLLKDQVHKKFKIL
jgi:hypothetical protein